MQSGRADLQYRTCGLYSVNYRVCIFLYTDYIQSFGDCKQYEESLWFYSGIRPGKPTSDYLNQILNYIVFIGAVGLSIVAFIPIFFNGVFKADVSFGGTSIIIIVGVVIETIKQVESQMRVRYYKGF